MDTNAGTPQKSRKLTVQKILAMQDEIAALDKKIASLQRRTQSNTGLSTSPIKSSSPTSGPQFATSDSSGAVAAQLCSSPSTAYVPLLPADVSCGNDDDDEPVTKLMASELCQLAAAGDLVGLRTLLSEGMIVDCQDYDGRTPLHLAVLHGHLEAAQLLLDHGASRTAEDEEGKTAVDYALESQHQELRDLLTFVPTTDATVAEPDSFLRTTSPHDAFDEASGRSVTSSGTGGDRTNSWATTQDADMVIVMVGLPGRGKSYVAHQIRRYFTWNHSLCQIVTHQAYRKRATGTTASYLPNMPDAEYRTGSLIAKELKDWFKQNGSGGGSVAIVDGTHSTPARRKTLHACLREAKCVPSNRIIFVEVFNSDPQLIRTNVMRAMAQQTNPSPTFVEDYYRNMEEHEAVYKPLSAATDPELRFIRIVDQSTFYLHKIDGWGPSRLAYMLHNLRHTPVDLYLTRSGEYEDLVDGRIGGNSRLSQRGEAYSQALFDFMREAVEGSPFVVMSSCSLRCKQTVQHFVASTTTNATVTPVAYVTQKMGVGSRLGSADSLPSTEGGSGVATGSAAAAAAPSSICRVGYFPTLDDLNHGDCEGQLLSEIWRTLPNTMASMKLDPYHVAWPNGESIHQLFAGRLEPHIHEIQASREPLLIVSHDPLIQGFFAYFVPREDGKLYAPEEAHSIRIPMHTVIRVRQHHDSRVAELIDLTDRVEALLRGSHPTTPSGRSAPQPSSVGLSSPPPTTSHGMMLPRGSTVW